MPTTPQPIDEKLLESADAEDVRASLRDTLRKIKARSKTGRLNEDSRLFRMKQRLTELGSVDDVARRAAILAEHDAEHAAKNGSGAHRIPDAIPD